MNNINLSVPKSNLELRRLNRSDIVIILLILLVAFWLGMKWADYGHKRAYNKNLKHRIYDL